MFNNNRNISCSLFKVILSGFLFVSLFCAPSSFAAPDYIFFSVNGDTTTSSMIQGEEFFWGSNCDLGATINWEIWYDINSNSIIDHSTDFMLNSENITDGSPLTEAEPILDGWSIGPPMLIGLQPGNYIFKATDIESESFVQKIFTTIAMPSPPNQLTGHVIIPGYPAPNSLLADRYIFAETETGDEGIFAGTTDNNGYFEINIGASGTGIEFFIESQIIPGFVRPSYISAVASGVVNNNDLTYTPAADSIWGFVKDELGELINFEGGVFANDVEFGSVEKHTPTNNSRYVIYFSEAEKGNWMLGIDDYVYGPTYLSSEMLFFSHDTLNSFQHDITLTKADTAIYVIVTENGGAPMNNYQVSAFSFSLLIWTNAVSGTDSDNMATLQVSSLDNFGWSISIETESEDFPIPTGLIVPTNFINFVLPGDTVTIDLIDGQLVSGTITQDPDDSPLNWFDISVGAGDFLNNNFNGFVDGGGTYSLYTNIGSYNMWVNAEGYITNPAWRNVIVTGDTTGNDLGYTINETHCIVSGTLLDLPLPLDNSYNQVVAMTGTDGFDGYYVTALVDSVTGTYSMNLCEGDWTIIPPCCFNEVFPANASITILESPDNFKTVDFSYASDGGCCLVPGDANHNGEAIISDLTYFVDYMFNGSPAPICFEEFDTNGNCEDGISNLTYFIDWMFQGGPPPVDCHVCP